MEILLKFKGKIIYRDIILNPNVTRGITGVNINTDRVSGFFIPFEFIDDVPYFISRFFPRCNSKSYLLSIYALDRRIAWKKRGDIIRWLYKCVRVKDIVINMYPEEYINHGLLGRNENIQLLIEKEEKKNELDCRKLLLDFRKHTKSKTACTEYQRMIETFLTTLESEKP